MSGRRFSSASLWDGIGGYEASVRSSACRMKVRDGGRPRRCRGGVRGVEASVFLAVHTRREAEGQAWQVGNALIGRATGVSGTREH